MSLDLSTIKFSVETTELDTAVKKIESLGYSVEGLATSLGQLDKRTAEANRKQAQANLNNAKTEAINIKNAKTLRDSAAASDELTEATRKRQSVEERQAAITRLMAEGNSRGQASILATAEALGEATEKTNEYLKAQRAMSSNNPFDRSLGAATVFANELKVATVASDLYNKDLGFTKNQLQELGREHVRLTEQFKVQGKSLSGLDAEFNKIVQSAQQVTQAENTMAAAMKNADKATVDAGKANAYIESELQKVRFALQANNEELNRSTSNSLVRFENALKKSGLTLDQQRVKIDEYRKAQIELQKTQKANQTDYITRAVGPQITDIIVGLSTGQSPLTVMMQQGGQLRDQFGMMGIAAKDMGDVMRNAMKGMAQSVFDTGKAIGTMLVGGIFDAGKAVVNLGMNITGLNSVMDFFKQKLAAQGEEGFKYIGMLTRIGAVLTGVVAVGLTTGLALLVAFGVGLKQVIEQESALSKAMALSGASLGLTQQGAIDLASAYAGAGGSVGAFTEAITESAKAGSITQDNLFMVTSAAIELEKVAGVKVAETIKSFAKLGEEPAKEFAKLAAEIGTITPEVVALVYSLEQQGEKAQAATIATAAYSAALKNAAGDIRTDMGYLESFFSGIGSAAGKMWDAILDIGRKGSLTVELDAATAKLQERITKGAAFYETKGDYAFAISNLKETVRLAQEQVDKEKELGTQKKENAKTIEATTKWEDIKLKNLSYEKKEATEIAKIRKAGIDAGITEVEIQQQINAVIAKRPKASEAKESELQKAINKAKEDFIDIQNKVNGVNKEFNNKLEGQQLLLKEGVINIEQYKDVVIALIQQQKFYTDGLAQEEKQLKLVQKAWADTNKEQSKKDDDYLKSYDALKAQSAELKNATSEIEFQLGLVGKSEEQQKLITREHKLQNDLREVQVKLEEEIQKIRAEGKDGSLEVIARENAAEKIKDINASTALQAAQDMQKEFDAIKSSITDVVMTSLFEGGKAGSKKIRELLTAALMKPIRVVVDAVVNTLMGSVMGSIGGSSSGGTSGSNAGSFASSLNGGISSAITTGFSSLASSSLGQSMGLSTSVGVMGPPTASGAAPTMLTSFGTQASSWATAIGGTMAGIALGSMTKNMISGGFSVSKGMDTFQNIGVVVGSAIGGPILGAAVGAVAGLINRAFGRKLSDTGLTGSFGGKEGFSGSSYQDLKGGWFRSDKTNLSTLDSGIEKGLADQFKALQVQSALMATTLGLSAESVAAFTADIRVSFKDLTEEEIQKKLQEEFTKISDSIAMTILGSYKEAITTVTEEIASGAHWDSGESLTSIVARQVKTSTYTPSEFAKEGETASETLTRLSTSLLSVNASFDLLGIKLLDIGLIGASTASAFADAFGGVENMLKSVGSFYDSFFSAEEKTANLTRNTTKAFSDLGVVMPEVNSELNNWYKQQVLSVMALDQSIPTNAKMTASLLSLQGNVLGLTASLVEVEEVITEVVVEVDTAAIAFAAAMQKVTDNLNSIGAGLQDQWDKLYLSEADYRAKQIKGMTALQVAQYDTNIALQNSIDTFKAFADTVVAFQKQVSDEYLASVRATDDAYNALIKSQETEIKLLQDRTSITDSALTALGESIDSEKKRIQLLIEGEAVSTEAAKSQVSAIKSIFELLTNSIKELRSEVTATAEMQFSAAKDLIQLAISSGNLPSQEVLSEAIGSVKTGLNTSTFSTKTDRDRAFLVFANDLEKLSDIAKPQLSTAEQMLVNSESSIQLYKNQLIALDAQLEQAQDQVKLLRGLSTQAKSIDNALIDLNKAISSERESFGLIQSIKDQVKASTDTYNELRGLNTGVLSLNDSIKALIAAILSETTAGAANALVNPLKPKAVQPFTDEERSTVIGMAEAAASVKGTTREAELYNYAKSQGYTDEMIDVKMGFAVGTAKSWSKDNPSAIASNPSVYDSGIKPDYSYITPFTPEELQTVSSLAIAAGLSAGTSAEVALINYAKSQGYTSGMLDRKMGFPSGTSVAYAIGHGLPAFESGINNVPYDMTARIHEGEAVVPKQFNPFNPNAMSGDSEVVLELKSLRTEVQMLRVEARTTAINTAKLNNNFERSIVPTNEGDALLVKTAV